MEHNRKCIACGEYKNRGEMIKITKEHKSGKLFIQPDSKIFGRSAYLCYNQNCINKVIKKGLNKILKTNLSQEELKGLLDGQLKSQ